MTIPEPSTPLELKLVPDVILLGSLMDVIGHHLAFRLYGLRGP